MLEELRDRLRGHDEVLFACLFGSQAVGRADANSDLDVAVYLSRALSERQRFDVRLQLIAELDELGRPDITVLNDAPALLAHRALSGERLLVRDRTAYVRFFVRTMAMAEDERYWREMFAADRRDRVREGRFGRP